MPFLNYQNWKQFPNNFYQFHPAVYYFIIFESTGKHKLGPGKDQFSLFFSLMVREGEWFPYPGQFSIQLFGNLDVAFASCEGWALVICSGKFEDFWGGSRTFEEVRGLSGRFWNYYEVCGVLGRLQEVWGVWGGLRTFGEVWGLFGRFVEVWRGLQCWQCWQWFRKLVKRSRLICASVI